MSVIFAKIQDIPANTVLGRNDNDTGVVSSITVLDKQLLIGMEMVSMPPLYLVPLLWIIWVKQHLLIIQSHGLKFKMEKLDKNQSQRSY